MLALCLSLCATLSGAAPDETPTVRERIARGLYLLESQEYEAASDELMIASSDPRATIDERVEANLHAGIANRILGRDVEARLNFTFVLKHAPDTKLPEDTSPKIQTFFDLVQQEIELSSRPVAVEAESARGELRAFTYVGGAVTAVSAIALIGAIVVGSAAELAVGEKTASGEVRQTAITVAWVSLGLGAVSLVGLVGGTTLFAVGVVE